ncbi:MAG: hypothetical protein GY718_13025 [Lentisphaerae bacterium]|nr:hypothetical protein [Lentisphaerota bacterium]
MNLENKQELFPNKIHFVGIGGAGTAPLAGIMLQRGNAVSGSDIKLNDKTSVLADAGADVFCGHSAANLANDVGLVVYTSAADKDNPELLEAKTRGLQCLRRGDFLARLSSLYKRQVAVSGSHGKTTVTAMLAWTLKKSGLDCGYMVGGEVNDFKNYAAGDGDIFVTEADESDGTHSLFSPWLGVVTNVEDDHSWSVGGDKQLFKNFGDFANQSSKLIYWDDQISGSLFSVHDNVRIINNALVLSELIPSSLQGFMRIDAAIVCAIAEEVGVPFAKAAHLLEGFPGVDRRMSVHYSGDDLSVVEDYAHHPTEVKYAIELLRLNYPNHHLRVVFQPHRFARLSKYIDEFAEELREADTVFTVPVFAAWTEVGEIDSSDLAAKVGNNAFNLNGDWCEMPEAILEDLPDSSVIAVLGAGDVNEVIPHLLSSVYSK